MKKYFFLFLTLINALPLMAQNEIKPDGSKLLWAMLIIVTGILAVFIFRKKGGKKKPLFLREKISIELEKNRLYFPDNIKMAVKNIGNADIDLDRPWLVFDNFWLKRKFRLKGINNREFYPLYLDKGGVHTLNIDLNHFYLYDKKLKNYPKIKITISNVKGKKLGSSSVYTRKTLIKF